MDGYIGRVLGELDRKGITDNTIVVYTSDHGDMMGSHGYTKKQWFYEESSHIPLVVSYPGRITPGPRDQLISITDMAPTLAGFLGLSFTSAVDGRDLSATLTDAGAPGQDSVYLFNHFPCHQAWNRQIGSWRAVVSCDGFMLAADEYGNIVHMSDLRTDPLQMRDLSEDEAYAGRRSALYEMLKRHVEANDGFMLWEDLIKKHGLLNDWNASQIHFGYPPIE
jgi:arylsulfatase A-like enzyme